MRRRVPCQRGRTAPDSEDPRGRCADIGFQSTADLLASGLLPVACFVGAGYLLARRLKVDLHPVARVALYIFSPSLVLSTLSSPGLSLTDGLGIAGYAGIMVVVALLLSSAAGRAIAVEDADRASLRLAAVFPNSANLGLPIVAFALGGASLKAAVIFVLTQIVLINTVGAYVASRAHVRPGQALRRVLGLPSIWAMAFSVVPVAAHGALPPPVERAFRFGADAYAPTVLVVLGGSLAAWRPSHLTSAVPWTAAGLRLLIMPALGWALALVLRLPAPVGAAVILQTSMPMAVNTLVLAQEFRAGADRVAGLVGLTTSAALLTVPLWLITVSRFW